MAALTPMMAQYMEVKNQYKDVYKRQPMDSAVLPTAVGPVRIISGFIFLSILLSPILFG